MTKNNLLYNILVDTYFQKESFVFELFAPTFKTPVFLKYILPLWMKITERDCTIYNNHDKIRIGYDFKDRRVFEVMFVINNENLKDINENYNFDNLDILCIWIPESMDRSSNLEDIVLDCFCGSGTTCVVAYKLERKFIGIDKNVKAINI